MPVEAALGDAKPRGQGVQAQGVDGLGFQEARSPIDPRVTRQPPADGRLRIGPDGCRRATPHRLAPRARRADRNSAGDRRCNRIHNRAQPSPRIHTARYGRACGETMAYTINVNGADHTVDVDEGMPLLWVLRDVLGMTGTKFSCGVAQCGACMVQVDGEAQPSCVLPIDGVGAAKITTIEAIAATPAGRKVQKAWIDLDVVQCGYCQSGQVVAARRPADRQRRADRRGHRRGHAAQRVPLRNLRPHPRGDPSGGQGMRRETMLHAPWPADPQRRALLKAAAAGGLLVAFHIPAAAAEAKDEFAPNAQVRLRPDGHVIINLPRSEMGQGVFTALAMMAAEEMDVDLDKVSVGDSARGEAVWRWAHRPAYRRLHLLVPRLDSHA